MNYNISSNYLSDPFLKELLGELIDFFNSTNTKFFIIGATARDIILDYYGHKSPRATRDLDVAVAIDKWNQYANIQKELLKRKWFTKDNSQKQRFYYKNIYPLDIVPFGEIMNEDDKIFWPAEYDTAMSVLGFPEVNKATKTVCIDDNLTVRIADLAGIFLLKTVAWRERHSNDNRDASDLGFILNNYFSINENRIYKNFLELFQRDDFDITSAGAFVLGTDLSQIIMDSYSTKQKVIAIFEKELQLKEESSLMNQIIETNRNFKYELTFKCIQNIIKGLQE